MELLKAWIGSYIQSQYRAKESDILIKDANLQASWKYNGGCPYKNNQGSKVLG